MCTKLYSSYSKVVTTQRTITSKNRVRLRKKYFESTAKERTEKIKGENVIPFNLNY